MFALILLCGLGWGDEWNHLGKGWSHAGVDIPMGAGEAVKSKSDGTVLIVWCSLVDKELGWVGIADGPVTHIYAHIEPAKLWIGQKVKTGDALGTVLGWRGDIHVHYGVMMGVPTPGPPPLAVPTVVFPGTFIEPGKVEDVKRRGWLPKLFK